MKLKYPTLFILVILCQACGFVSNPNDEMVELLARTYKKFSVKENTFCPEAEHLFFDSLSKNHPDYYMKLKANYFKANSLLKLGREQEAVDVLEGLMKIAAQEQQDPKEIAKIAALAYLRLGERQNCVVSHTSESCIMPIKNSGVHQIQMGSRKAIEVYEKLLQSDPYDYESRWLLNICYMTVGDYPLKVPSQWLIPNLDKDNSGYSIKPFTDVAPQLGLNKRNKAGGVIIDDFNSDGYLDIVTSDWGLDGQMHYFKNNRKDGYIDCSEKSNLGRFKGGLNIIQADYDNDGDIDIFVLRGAWMGIYGQQANSLLRNNGDDTFIDVTKKSGLFSENPTQAGVWQDFNNDGWLDLFIGNESTVNKNQLYPCELYISNGDGTFKEVAKIAGCDILDFVKGVTSADYDNDGLQDICTSGTTGYRTLLKNKGVKNGIPVFENVTEKAGLADVIIGTFPTWFWDYDNDGWQDIFVCGYQASHSVAYAAAAEALKMPNASSKMYLYHNNHDGTFTNVSEQAGLNKSVFAMGSNFGDIDNDGYLDMYLGTGNPDYKSLVPNRLFRNMGNGNFADVTVSGRVGNLQKGHAVAMTDMDNDGDQDIFIEVGGAYIGDSYNNSLYLNPGQNDNRWINLRLEGQSSNRSAIGAKVKVIFTENGQKRVLYREVNSGGSFGASSLRREVGIGQANIIDEIVITWPKTGKIQHFKNVKPNQFLKIQEGNNVLSVINLKKIDLSIPKSTIPICKTSVDIVAYQQPQKLK